MNEELASELDGQAATIEGGMGRFKPPWWTVEDLLKRSASTIRQLSRDLEEARGERDARIEAVQEGARRAMDPLIDHIEVLEAALRSVQEYRDLPRRYRRRVDRALSPQTEEAET